MNARAALYAFLCVSCAACIRVSGETVEGSGTGAEETRTAGGIRSVSLSLPGTLVIEQGDAEGLRIEADDNLLPYIVAEVDGDELSIRAAEDVSLRPRAPLRFHLVVNELEAVNVTGSGDVEAQGLRTDDLALSLAGSGGVRLSDLEAEALTVEGAGSGDVDVSGKVRRLELSLAGSGDVAAADLLSEEAEVSIAGSGSADVHVRDRLAVDILGSGSVRYRGDPRVESSIMGSGEVERL